MKHDWTTATSACKVWNSVHISFITVLYISEEGILNESGEVKEQKVRIWGTENPHDSCDTSGNGVTVTV